MRLSLAVLGVAVAPGFALAQQPAERLGGLRGQVYDSVARGPVRGASVQIVPAAARANAVTSVTSDADGRYLFSSLTPGKYLITFEHPALDTLALVAPVGSVEVPEGAPALHDLAVPSPRTIIAAACGPIVLADSSGLLVGRLRDAQSGFVLDSGEVSVRWQELLITSGAVTLKQDGARAPVREGWFAVCDVPGGSDVIASATSRGDSTGLVELQVPVHGVRRQDFLMGGRATLRGLISSERRVPLANARVTVAGSERRAATDSSGAFVLRDVPAGSQTLEVRALGYAPEYRRIDLSPQRDTSLAITLTSVKRVLDTIRVVGQRVYNMDSHGFLRRQRGGVGHFIDEETVRRRNPIDLLELLRGVPSIRFEYQGLSSRTPVMRSFLGEACTPAFYLNGARMPDELLTELDMLARPEELVGMEIYRGPTTPPQFSTLNGCGAVVVWTRARGRGR